MKMKTVRRAFLATVPVMAGYLVLGTAYGILLTDKGFPLLFGLVQSLLIYAGSMQFVGINLLAGGASLVQAAIMTLLVNARHLFYGFTMLEKYRDAGKMKPYLIFGLTDETFALVVNEAPAGSDRNLYFLLVTLFDQCWWVTGTLIGCLAGSAISFNTEGIDFAMTALFIVIFTEQIMQADDYLPAVTGVASSLICLLIFGPDSFLIPAMLLISALLTGYSLLCNKKGGPTHDA
ncbi:MAG: AzlC family ABC transporter permease [Lachnospiraceae bacterium]|nr:AzlC family ABC transporter permease [Lachnospiraceae bacterium]